MADTNTTINNDAAANKTTADVSEKVAMKPEATVNITKTETEATVAATAPKKTVAKKTVRKTKARKPAAKKVAAKTANTNTKGKTKMADTVKRVTRNTKAANTKAANKAKGAAESLGARVESLGETAQVRAKAAAERAVAFSKTAVEFNRENIEALIESGKITARGASEISKTNMKFGRENLVEASRALQGAFSVSAPKDFFAKQTDFLRSSLDRMIEQANVNKDASVKLAGNAYQPIATRISEIRKEMKKAA